MSTLEEAITMLQELPDAEVKAIHDIIYVIYVKNRTPIQPLSKEQILKDLSISREEITRGDYQDLDDALDEIEVKYGL